MYEMEKYDSDLSDFFFDYAITSFKKLLRYSHGVKLLLLYAFMWQYALVMCIYVQVTEVTENYCTQAENSFIYRFY